VRFRLFLWKTRFDDPRASGEAIAFHSANELAGEAQGLRAARTIRA